MKSKAPLILMEQMAMLLVFALAAALCLQAFVKSDSLSSRSRDRDRAVTLAQTVAETVRASGGSPGQAIAAAAEKLGYRCDQSVLDQSFDGDWTAWRSRAPPRRWRACTRLRSAYGRSRTSCSPSRSPGRGRERAMDSKRRFTPPPVGGVSLLVVFAVLCLTVFALLSLSTVQADVRLADASVRAVSEYYAADRQAQEILARLRAGEFPEEITMEGDVYGYTCPISENRNLKVEVRLRGSEYTVLCWQSVPAEEWESDDTLELWDGGLPF